MNLRQAEGLPGRGTPRFGLAGGKRWTSRLRVLRFHEGQAPESRVVLPSLRGTKRAIQNHNIITF